MVSALNRALQALMIGLIWLYKRGISPLLPPLCRHYPTCSQYAAEAIRVHGPWRGGGLALRRLSRCHPLNPGGYDPVPPAPPARCACTASHQDR